MLDECGIKKYCLFFLCSSCRWDEAFVESTQGHTSIPIKQEKIRQYELNHISVFEYVNVLEGHELIPCTSCFFFFLL